jgi:hypothetical protein
VKDSSEQRTPGRRQVVSLWIGAILGVAVVAGVLAVTLVSGDGSSSSTESTTTAPGAPIPEFILTALTDPGPIPAGDYGPMCTELLKNATPFGPDPTPAQLADVMRKTDLPALVGLAPAGMRPSLALLADSRTAVVDVLESVSSFSELGEGDFPDGFWRAVGQLIQVTQARCITG